MDHLIGKRIRLLSMPGDPDPILPGSTGTVTHVSPSPFNRGHWHVSVKWDCSRSLSMLVPPDRYEVISHEAEAAKDYAA